MRAFVSILFCLLLLGVPAIGLHAPAEARSAISERVYERLAKVHSLMDAGRHDEALQSLAEIRTNDARPYENALWLQTYGYLRAAKEQYAQAVDAFTRCLALDALPKTATKNTLYALAQVQVVTADYSKAVVTMQRWFKLERKPPPQAHVLAGSANAQTKRYAAAIKHLTKAIALAKQPKDDWYQTLLAVYYEAERYPAAASLLQTLVRRFPERKAYWLQLSRTYQILKDEARALAVMELAYRRGLAFDEGELINLARYYLHMEIPYKAGRLLEQALREGKIRSTGEHWRLVSDAWLSAKEPHRALAALEQALELIPDARMHLRRAHLAVEAENWSVVLQAVKEALAIGGLQQPGMAHLLRGIARYHLAQHNAALEAFEQAKGFEHTQDQAAQWADYLGCELKQRERAAQSGASGEADS